MKVSSLILAMSLLIVGMTLSAAENAPMPTCHEDEPCWDCRTMGNRICGPFAPLPDGSQIGPNRLDYPPDPATAEGRPRQG